MPETTTQEQNPGNQRAQTSGNTRQDTLYERTRERLLTLELKMQRKINDAGHPTPDKR